MRDPDTGFCNECQTPPEAYHSRRCSQFKGYHCWKCEGTYFGDYCPNCPPPWWVRELPANSDTPN